MEMNQYLKFAQNNINWLPGKEAIEHEIKAKYKVSPQFIAMQEIASRTSAFNGIFVYNSDSDCKKLTTCGLTQIVPNEYAFGKSRSGWGAELSVTIKSTNDEEVNIYAKLLVQLAQYVNARKTMFTEFGCINLSRLRCREHFIMNDIAGVVFIQDTMLESIETLHGSVDFLQVIGVNTCDWKKIWKTPSLIRQYIYEFNKDNPNYCINRFITSNVLE